MPERRSFRRRRVTEGDAVHYTPLVGDRTCQPGTARTVYADEQADIALPGALVGRVARGCSNPTPTSRKARG